MSVMKNLIRPVSLLLAFATVASQPFAVAVMAAPAPAPMPLPFFMPDDGDGNNEEGEDLIATQKAVFEQLFKAPWSQEAWTYPLEQKVEGEGFYEGANQYSQPFGLEVKVAAKVELDAVGLPDDQYEFAKTRGFEYYGVIGTLKTELATVTVTGVAFSQGSDIAATESYFMLVNTVDAENALFDPTPAAGVQDAEVEPQWFPMLVPKFCPDSERAAACEAERQGCIDAAEAAYQADVDAAQDRFDAQEAAAKTLRDNDVASAKSTFELKKSEYLNQLAVELSAATVVLTAAHVLCAFTLFGALACVVAAQAVYAAAVAASTLIYDSNVRMIELDRDNSISAAQSAYATTVGQAKAALQTQLDNLRRGLQRDLRDCDAAFDACMRELVPVVCGWRVLWVRVK